MRRRVTSAALPELRAPGVYFEPTEERVPPLELLPSGVPVFLGITRRGPLDRPVRVDSEARFLEVFGERVPGGYLAPAVRGFFDNGGETCFVLRVARLEGGDDEDVARSASSVLLDRAGEPAVEVTAMDPGAWGNTLRVAVADEPPVRTLLTRDASSGERAIQVKSTHGITPGSTLRISAGEVEQWVVVRGLEGKSLELRGPLVHDFESAAPTYVETHTFQLRVSDLDGTETFEGLSLDGASARFVERVVAERSRLVRARWLRAGTAPGLARPAVTDEVRLGGGGDGVTDLGPEDFIGHDRGPGDRRGLAGLVGNEDVDLVVMPDLMAAHEQSRRFRTLRDVEAVQDAAVTLCERSSNKLAILDIPAELDFEEALRWRQQFDSAHAALYFPWVWVLEGSGKRAVPPSGHIAGIFARSDRGHGIHKAPANEQVEGIVDLTALLQDAHLAMLNDAGVNCMRPFASRGIRVWGARTCSSDPEWRYLNVRRTISSVAEAIERGTQWAVFENNGPRLWKRVSRLVTGFLLGLRERGMLVGETPEEAFFVKCDAETNPREEVDRGMLVARIGLAVTRPVEFIVFRLSQRLEDQAQADEE